MSRIFLLTCCLMLSLVVRGQFGAERAALNRMQKGKWKSAEESLRRALKRDSLSTEANFTFSWYYQDPANPVADLDSSWRYAVKAIHAFSKATVKDREQLKRFPIDSLILLRQREKIDSLSFESARTTNTEEAYEHFITSHPAAAQRPAAAELRDELAYVEALKVNTWGSFYDYLHGHPGSTRAPEAQQRYEKLLYTDKTRDGKLRSFAAFCHEFPANVWCAEAEKNIFEISTASGRPAAFLQFIERYPASPYRNQAVGFRYHLLKDDEHDASLLSDSLKLIQHQERGYWVPFLRNGKFGFMDQYGTETIKASFDSIRQDYTCGNIHTDYLIVNDGIINRAGARIVTGRADDVQDLGLGFLKVTRGLCVQVVHKSGANPDARCYSDAKLVGRHFLAFQENGKWGLQALTGKIILTPQYDDVVAFDTVFVLVKNGKKTITTLDDIAAVADRNPLGTTLVFDDIRRMASGSYVVRNGALEGVMDSRLEFIVPLKRCTILRSVAGYIMEENGKFNVTGLPSIPENQEFDAVRFYGNWVDLRSAKRIQLYNIQRKRPEPINPDSVWFDNRLAFARHRDSLTVYLSAAVSVNFPADNKITFIRSVDSTGYFFVSDKKKKTIFDAVTGKRLFSFAGDGAEYMGHRSFLVTRGNKKGIFYQDGKPLLPVEYAAIAPLEGEWASLLKDGKFGLYHLVSHRLVKAVYSRNVKPYSRKLLIAFKDSGYGFMDMEAKPQGNFEFDEIRVWNDTAALVRKNFQWMIYGFRSRTTRLSGIREYHYVAESPQENIAIIRRDNYYGVISNRRGELIPANFSGITNIGSSEDPLFFSEKNVEEAGIHVIIYYDRNGRILRKQALEEAEFERIECNEN